MFTFAETLAFLEEAVNQIFATSASPGFSWGRSGTVTKGAWLQNDTVPSNVSGRTVFLAGAVIKKIFVANEDPVALKIELYHHDGAGVALTLLGSVTTGAVRTSKFDVTIAVPVDKQLALRVASDSPNQGKNLVAGVIIAGTLA